MNVWQTVATGETLAIDLWRLTAPMASRRMLCCLELLEKRAKRGGNLRVIESALATLERFDNTPEAPPLH